MLLILPAAAAAALKHVGMMQVYEAKAALPDCCYVMVPALTEG